jgi:transcriptional regulator with PAS, ATPase and Fis domain
MAIRTRSRAPAEVVSLIEGLPEPLIVTDLDYRIVAANRAYRTRHHAGEDVIGRFCYEVSHHYDAPCDEAGADCACPRRAALRSRHSERVVHVHHTPHGTEHVKVQISPIQDRRGRTRFFVERLRAVPTAGESDTARSMVGGSPVFLEMMDLVSRVAPTDTNVLLLGETGTGKEMVAQSIHESSKRAEKPFVVVDCSGLSESLFENELFGHEKGAFTGAATPKIGLVEAADGGTLFLDEVGDIPLAEQVKLLRLIETGTFRRVGGVEPRRTNVRLVAATHRDLPKMVEDGTFRRDLYYRISAFPIHLPALRERGDDIPELVTTLLQRIQPTRALRPSPNALEALRHYGYPGNVRELRNILERAALLADGDGIYREHLPRAVLEAQPPAEAPIDVPIHGEERALRAVERMALERALAKHGQNRKTLAEALGISERTLYRKLRAYGLNGPGPGSRPRGAAPGP